MKVTSIASVQSSSTADQGRSPSSRAPEGHSVARKAVVGGGWIATLPVAAHARKQNAKAVVGGGWITTLPVAAHARKQAAQANASAPQGPRESRKAVIGGGWVTTTAVAAHVRRMAASADPRSSQAQNL
jgi:hypothetical protein